MTLRQRGHLLTLTALLVAVAGVGVLVAGMTIPVSIETVSPSTSNSSARVVINAAESKQKPEEPEQSWRQDLLRICSIDLRPPLFDPVPQAGIGSDAEPVDNVSTPMEVSSLRLLGTIIEPGHSMAMLHNAAGSVVLARQGEQIEDAGVPATIVRVEPLMVVIRRAGKTFELHLPPPVQGAAP